MHVFGSMCEAFGIIILETIASSLPIICNNFPVFKEILKKNTLYFNAQNPKNIFQTGYSSNSRLTSCRLRVVDKSNVLFFHKNFKSVL